MKTVYLTSGDAVATVGSDKADAGVGSGLMLGADGKTIGFDLYAEIAPSKWVLASALPEGMLRAERQRGTLTAGILVNGQVYDKLNVHNVHDKLIAAKVGLELKADEYKGGATAFKAQIGDPLEQLSKKIENLVQQLEELKAMDREADALELRLKKVEKQKKEEAEEQTRREEEPYTFMDDFARAYKGKALTTSQIEDVIIGQTIADLTEDGKSLLGNAAKMRALRGLLLQ